MKKTELCCNVKKSGKKNQFRDVAKNTLPVSNHSQWW